MRFASHRDVARAIERGVRKAGLPVAYSAGFSPHPRISYSGGAPTGSSSEAEYLELAVTRRCEPDDVGWRLDAALPDGIDVVEVVEADNKSASAQLEASEWEVVWPGVPAEAAASAVRAFLAEASVSVERLTSKGTRTLDARAAVISLVTVAERRAGTDPATERAILRMVVLQLTPAVRPDDILVALRQSLALEPTSPPLVTRLWQGPVRQRPDPVPRLEDHLPRPTSDKAMRLEAQSAETAPASQSRANEQLPRGALSQVADLRAREPYGRDRPDARNRATESTVRIQ